MNPLCKVGKHRVIKKIGKVGNAKIETWTCARKDREWSKSK